MRSKEEIKAILEEAREMEVPAVTIDGVTYDLSRRTLKILPKYVEELKAEEIVKPLSPLDEYSEEEILYYSTPYFDEIQARKEAAKNQKQQDDELRKSVR